MSAINYLYDTPSSIAKTGQQENLFLSKFSEDVKGSAPCLFWGRLNDPFVLSRCLITLSKTVQANFNLHPSQLALIKDPIVTAGNQQIRFEGFSICAGVYARVDVLEDGQDGEFLENGTTNVDFNTPLITELSRIQKNDKLVLSVGKKEVGFHKDGESFVERKVPLPTKWIKGLTTVQHYFAESESTMQLSKVQAIQLFRSIPNGKVKTDYYLIKRGGRYSFSPAKSKNSLCIGGIHRLKLLSPLLPLINGLTVYQHESQQAANLVLHFDRINFTFSLSRNFWRGFSGEGAALEELLEDLPHQLLGAFDNYAYTNQSFNPLEIAIDHDLDFAKIERLSAKLAAMGLLGFDLEKNNYFYRRLPFKLSRILALNPRLKGAEKLLTDGNVQITANENGAVEARVQSGGTTHYVVVKPQMEKCTCLWYSRNQGERGPCKHILATKKMIKNS
ncbi:MAG: SWIM zinc finger family protein [Bacteroidota bacterium]